MKKFFDPCNNMRQQRHQPGNYRAMFCGHHHSLLRFLCIAPSFNL